MPKFSLAPLAWRRDFIDDPMTWSIKRRLRERRNTMIVWLGNPRSGKTNAEIVQGEQVCMNRPLRARDLSFLPQDYVKALSQGEPGDYKGFDEPGAEWGARSFMSIENKMLNATHVTFGSRYITVGWAIPVLKMQDVQARMLVKYVFVMNSSGPRGMSRFYENWVNHRTGKTGQTGKGGAWFARAFQDRDEELREYDELKKQYQDERYQKYYDEFAKADDPHAEKSKQMSEAFASAFKAVMEDPMAYVNSKGMVDRDAVRHGFPDLSLADSREVSRQANAKLKSQDQR